MSTLALTLAPSRSHSSARLVFQVACAAAGSALIAGLAQISIHLGFTPVPITGQTLGVLLVGAAYGPGLGTATVLLYLLEGVVGLPVF
ncbi:MAG: biotin transport system substrate-specific component, partial [Actinomycetota bacterium]|nr:biotin transport system substrate-specific component [Actinomycetota bacterium]